MNIDKKCKNQIDGEIPFTSKQIHKNFTYY